MVADIARVTYDPSRQYRSLVSQQGRVTLEADNNESVTLQSEALRHETIDIVGPLGTPDKGFALGSGTGPGGVTIGAGTLYLGGWRLENHKTFDLSSQPDWLDAPAFTATSGDFVVALLLTETTVTAFEDRALREVALGGPDTAARTRLMQRYLRLASSGATCAAGATSVAALLTADGVTLDKALELHSTARLQAGFVTSWTKTDVCLPKASGGYLGADNQLVRVTVTSYDSTKKTGTLLWGWNNASLVYRATVGADGATITLTDAPVDFEHAPQQTHVVELLRTAKDFGRGNYVAELEGDVVAVSVAYSFDTQQFTIATPLPANSPYITDQTPIFVRLWQGTQNFTAGQAETLDTTSDITVTITMDALPSAIAARPFWRFSVRPATPQKIYPQRYYDSPQPPDGPRQWLGDLGVISAQAKGSTLLADCVPSFNPLTNQQGGCCGLTLGPANVDARGGLQAVVDSLAGGPAVLSLKAGTYSLAAPLKLTAKHSGLTIEGCTGDVILAPGGTDMTPFSLGLILANAISGVALKRLTFAPKPFGLSANNLAGGDVPSVLFAVTIGAATTFAIEDCQFKLAAPSPYVIGAGLLVLGGTQGVRLRRNVFAGSTTSTTTQGNGALFGVWAASSSQNVSISLDQWEIVDNQFSGLAYGVAAYAQLGAVVCRDNVVAANAGGLVFIEANIADTLGYANEAANDQTNAQIGAVATGALNSDRFSDLIDKAGLIPKADFVVAPPALTDAALQALKVQLASVGAAAYHGALLGKSATTAANAAPAPTTGAAAPPAANIPAAAPGANAVLAPTPAPATPAAATAAAATAATSTPAATGAGPPATAAPGPTDVYEKVKTLSAYAEAQQPNLTPMLRFTGNDVTLSAGSYPCWVGIAALLSIKAPSSVMVCGNRSLVPTTASFACALVLEAGAVVTGNLFGQLQAATDTRTLQPAFGLLAGTPEIMVGANLISRSEYVFPAAGNARTALGATTSWDFLNTTG